MIKIEDILNDKDLFWKFILGKSCRYCKAYQNKGTCNGQTIEEVQAEALMSEKERKILELKRKIQKKAEEKSEYPCTPETCGLHIDYEQLSAKIEQLAPVLKENIDFWGKRKYNVYGDIVSNFNYICFEKEGTLLRYCNELEQFDKNIIIGATDLVLFSDWIKLTNEDVVNFCKSIKQ